MSEISHDRVQERLFAYLDDALAEIERAEVARHLESCSECAEELELCRRANGAFSSMRRHGLSEGFFERFEARLESERKVVAFPTPPPAPVEEAPGESESETVQPATGEFPVRAHGMWRTYLAVAAMVALVMWGWLSWFPRRGMLVLVAKQSDVRIQRGRLEMHPDRAVDLRVDDSVETGPDGLAVFAVGADSSLRVGPRTRLSVTESSPHDVAVRLSHGILRVSERRDVRVSVQTPDVLVRPVGTTYDVRVEGGMTTVIVSEGRVEVRPARGLVRTVGAGEQAEIGPEGVRVEEVGPEVARDPWTRWNDQVRIVPAAVGEALQSVSVPGERLRGAASPTAVPSPASGGDPSPASAGSPVPGSGTPAPLVLPTSSLPTATPLLPTSAATVTPPVGPDAGPGGARPGVPATGTGTTGGREPGSAPASGTRPGQVPPPVPGGGGSVPTGGSAPGSVPGTVQQPGTATGGVVPESKVIVAPGSSGGSTGSPPSTSSGQGTSGTAVPPPGGSTGTSTAPGSGGSTSGSSSGPNTAPGTAPGAPGGSHPAPGGSQSGPPAGGGFPGGGGLAPAPGGRR